MLPDDSAVSIDQYRQICVEAERCLIQADARGIFPTPIDQVIRASKIEVFEENSLDASFVKGLKRKFGKSLKTALSKVWGVLDSIARIIHLDETIIAVKKGFLKLHETGHVFLPWQRDIYHGVEDCEKTISPEISEVFEKEANLFATEVLFQLDAFEKEACDYKFGIGVPLKLAKKFGSSAYAAIRRYVTKNHRTCAVLVLNPPEIVEGDGFVATSRRVVTSHLFNEIFGTFKWPKKVTPDSEFGRLVPLHPKRMSKATEIPLTDVNGNVHICYAEGFATPYQVFILIQSIGERTKILVGR